MSNLWSPATVITKTVESLTVDEAETLIALLHAHSIDGNYIPQSAGLGFSGGGSAGGAVAASASSAGH